jgi:cytochrome P450
MMAEPVQLPIERSHPLQVPSRVRELQARAVIHEVITEVGDRAWLVTGYHEVQQLFSDSRLGRSHPAPAQAARMGHSALFGGPMGNYETEHADHERMRALLQPHFSPARVRALRPRVEELCSALLDELAAGPQPADLVAGLALPLPIGVICELLGVPFEDRAEFRQWSQAAADATDRERSEQGLASLYEYGLRLVAAKSTSPADDFISRLSAEEGVSDEEVAMLSMGLLFAGHETTVTAIGTGALLLLTHPDQQAALAASPALIPAAVEEILRVPNRGGRSGIPRYARTDIHLAGVVIKAGDLVLLDQGAANHASEVWPDPDRFDIARAPAGHVAFGHGSHYCLGAPLARLELTVVLGQLLARFPGLRLAVPVSELDFNRKAITGGLARLPVFTSESPEPTGTRSSSGLGSGHAPH